MWQLTREVRLTVDSENGVADPSPTNSYAGFPTFNGSGQFLRVQVSLRGALSPKSGYLRNIKDIDRAVRERLLDPSDTLTACSAFARLSGAFAQNELRGVRVLYTPFLTATQLASELGMYTRLSQKFEFSASHRLHNPQLNDEENRAIYGKCNSPNGHGHNYELQVTLRGKPNASGLIVDVPAFERIVKHEVVDPFDHKHLNLDVPAFRELVPTVENIAMTIYRMLKGKFAGIDAELASVTVWETPKTWCEYEEENGQ